MHGQFVTKVEIKRTSEVAGLDTRSHYVNLIEDSECRLRFSIHDVHSIEARAYCKRNQFIFRDIILAS